jgi:subtilisin family serine protease
VKRPNALLLFSLAGLSTAFAQSLPAHPKTILSTFRPPVINRAMNEIERGYILVKLAPEQADAISSHGTTNLAIRAPFELSGAAFESRIEGSGWTMWKIPDTMDPREAVNHVKGQRGVLAAQPVNRIYPLWTNPNDPDYTVEETDEGLILVTDPFYEGPPGSFRRLWHLTDTNAEAAWQVFPNAWYTAANKPATSPLIGIIDTGCDMGHPDFANAGNSSTDTVNGGQLDWSRSAQFRLGKKKLGGDPNDSNGHGTHVAGLAVASGNNGSFNGHGVIGTGYNARAFICRVFDENGTGTDADAAAAIYYAVNRGADILNISLGTENYSQLFQDAVTFAWQKGVLVICAGNEDGNGGGDLGPIYPAGCSGALGVTANGPDGQPATSTYAGYGTYVDVAAPGGDLAQDETFAKVQFIYSTSTRGPNDIENNPLLYPPYTREYSYLAGTSMATPIVSGAAALFYGYKNLKRLKGWANVRAYRAIEKGAAMVMGAPYGGWEPVQGYGCLDMWSMLMEQNSRGSQVGGAEGIIYYNGTPTPNVSVKAQKVSGGLQYSTTTNQHGYYRFEGMPAGTYKVWSAPFGALKTKRTVVEIGSDMTGFDFWCGTYTGDTTKPFVSRFLVRHLKTNFLALDQWAYDTETGIDKVVVKIGTAAGGSNVKAPTEVTPKSNVVQLGGLTVTPGVTYHITVTYTNGNGDSVNATATAVATA